jgi:hypothetical protein
LALIIFIVVVYCYCSSTAEIGEDVEAAGKTAVKVNSMQGQLVYHKTSGAGAKNGARTTDKGKAPSAKTGVHQSSAPSAVVIAQGAPPPHAPNWMGPPQFGHPLPQQPPPHHMFPPQSQPQPFSYMPSPHPQSVYPPPLQGTQTFMGMHAPAAPSMPWQSAGQRTATGGNAGNIPVQKKQPEKTSWTQGLLGQRRASPPPPAAQQQSPPQQPRQQSPPNPPDSAQPPPAAPQAPASDQTPRRSAFPRVLSTKKVSSKLTIGYEC